MTIPVKLTRAEEITNNIVNMKKEIGDVLPPHISVDRFIGVVSTALKINPKLVQSEPNSLYTAVLQAASDGLLPDNREGTIQMFCDQAKWMPMVGGICKSARRSGEIVNIDAIVVYEKDEFDAWTDEHGPHFKYRRARGIKRGNPILTFAYAITKQGEMFFEEIDEEQMTKIKKVALSRISSDNQKYSPWTGDFEDEQRRKTTLRRLLKYRTPSSKDLDNIIRREDVDFEENQEEQQKPEIKETKKKKSRVENMVEAQDAEIAEPKQEPEKEVGAKKNTTALTETGIITDMKISWVKKDGKEAEQKFSHKINDKYFGTFDVDLASEIALCADNKIPVKVVYTQRTSGNKTFNDIINFEKLEKSDVPI